MNFSALLLICSTTLTPPERQPSTALSVIAGPDTASEVQCALHGQAFVATTAVAPGDGEFLKIQCRRK